MDSYREIKSNFPDLKIPDIEIIKSNLKSIISEFNLQDLVIVTDSNILNSVIKQYNLPKEIDLIVLKNSVTPSIKSLNIVLQIARKKKYILGIGSGKISDICKHASFLSEKICYLYPTAPSSNGYASNYSLIEDEYGITQLLKSAAPHKIFIDTDTLCNAPQILINSGTGNLLCRENIQKDIIISSAVTGLEYDESIFDRLIKLEQKVIQNIHLLNKKDEKSILNLMEALLLMDVNSHIVDNTYPIYQSSHLISQLIQMKNWSKDLFYGELIAMNSFMIKKIQDRFINSLPPLLISEKISTGNIKKFFGYKSSHPIERIFEHKRLVGKKLEKTNLAIQKNWNEIQKKLLNVGGFENMEDLFEILELPTSPDYIEIDKIMYNKIISFSHITKNIFTFLDIHNNTEKQQ